MSWLGNLATVAGQGALVASTFGPGPGTVIGAGVGGLTGLLGTLLGGDKKEAMGYTSGLDPKAEAMRNMAMQYYQQQMNQPQLVAPVNDMLLKSANMMSSMYYGEPYTHQGFQPFNPLDTMGTGQPYGPEMPNIYQGTSDVLGKFSNLPFPSLAKKFSELSAQYAAKAPEKDKRTPAGGYYKK
jgi:hypothetical protein